MSNTIEAIFDGKVFRPESEVELKPNTRVEITVTVKSIRENPNGFRVRSKHLGIREDLNYDKTSGLIEEIEGAKKMITPDANIVLYAYNEDAPQHSRAKQWLEEQFSSPVSFGFELAGDNGFSANFD